MGKKYQTRHNWQTALSALAIGIGVIGLCPPSEAISLTSSTKKTASDQIQDNFQLAQVGIRSRINAPTPLNITPPPGTHIPLPTNSYYHGSRNYRGHQRGLRRDYSNYRRSRDYGRHEPCYDDHYYRGDYYRHRNVRKRYPNRSRGVVIIKSTSYGN